MAGYSPRRHKVSDTTEPTWHGIFHVKILVMNFKKMSIYLFLAALDLCCCVRAFSSFSEWGLLSSCSTRASHRSGFSCCGARVSVGVARGLCGTGVPLLLGHMEPSRTRDRTRISCIGWQILDQQGSLQALFLKLCHSTTEAT